MFKKLLMGLLIVSSLGCAHVVKEPENACSGGSCPITVAPEVPKVPVIAGTGWSIEVPDDFIVKVNPSKPMKTPDGSRELMAVSKRKEFVGQGPMVLIVTLVDLDPKEVSAALFGDAAALALAAQDEVDIIAVKKTSIQGHPGTVTLAIVSKTIMVGQVAVGSGTRGYLVICAGDAHEPKKVGDKCASMVKTFKLVP